MTNLNQTVAEFEQRLQASLVERDELLQQQTATNEVLQVINASSGDLAPVFDAILERAMRLCEAEFGLLSTCDDDQIRTVSTRGVPPAFAEFRKNNPPVYGPETGPARILAGERVVHIVDLKSGDAYRTGDPNRRAVVDLGGARTVLLVPLLKEESVLGFITIYRKEVRPYSDKQIALLQTFADQAVIAIENARLFNETREALEQQKASADILRAISSSAADTQPAFDKILDSCKHLFGSDETAVLLVDAEGICTLGAYVGKHQEVVAATFPAPVDKSPAGHAIREGRVVHYTDAANDAQLTRAVRHVAKVAGYEAMAYAPMMWNERGIGAIGVSRLKGSFSVKELALLQTFADQAVIAIQNARLFNETKAALERQTATADILKVIASSPSDVQPVFEAIAERSNRLVNGLSTAVYRLVDDTAHLMAFTPVSPEADAALQALFPAPALQIVWGEAISKGETYFLVDAEVEFAARPSMLELARLRGWRSSLAVPLIRERRPIGVITVTRVEPGRFDDHHVQLLKTFADQAVIAIGNVRLFEEVQAKTRDLTESLQQQTATADVLKIISRSAFDLQAVLDTLVESAGKLCNATMTNIWLRDGDVLRAQAQIGMSETFSEFLRTHPIARDRGKFVGRAFLTGELVHLPDVLADPEYTFVEAPTIGQFRSALGVPLIRQGQVEGVFALARPEPGGFTDREIELVRSFADQALIAIENVRLFDEVQAKTRDLTESLQQQTATADVLKIINRSSVDLETVLDTLVDTVARLCRADQAVMFRRRDDKYHLVAACGHTEEAKDFVLTHPFAVDRGTISGRVVLEHRAVHVADVLQDPEYTYREAQKIAGVRTMLGIPLLREQTLIGVFSINRTRVEPFTDKEIELATTFADQAVIAIENARLFEELRERQAELRVTFDNMGDGVVMFDASARLTAWNHNFQQMLDLPDAFLAGRPSSAEYFRYLADRGEYSTDLEAQLSSTIEDTRREMRFERTRPDGRVMEVRRNPVPGGGFVLIYADITERKRAEEAIRIARDAAETALRELQIAQASLVHAQKMAALGQVTAGIAHEIKNPLNFVNNFAGLSVELLDELKDVAAQAIGALETGKRAEVVETIEMLTGNLEKIVEHGRRADGIVRSMLQHSRGSSGEWQATDLNALVEEALNLAYHGARSQDQSFEISLERDLDCNLAPVDVVPQEMTRVLLNLIGNGFYAANKRSREGGGTFRAALKVTTREFGESVEVRVRDNGIGIPPENRDKLFQPFFTTKPTGEGTGLGLSISYEIVTQQHGGTITVDGEVGEFTEFTVRLPRRARAVAATAG